MRLLFLRVLAIVSWVAGALSHRANHVAHRRHAVESVTLARARRLEAHRNITIHIGLKQQHLDGIEETLMSVSHPDSPMYGQHWSPAKVAKHFAPSDATVSAVESWLIKAGFHPDQLRLSRSKGWISIRTSVPDIGFLLKMECDVHTHSPGHERISCESSLVPEEVREHVDLIRVTHVHKDAPLLKYSNHTQSKTPSFSKPLPDGIVVHGVPSLANCDKFTTPQCLRQLYSIDIKPEVPQRNSFAVGLSSFVKFTCFS
jgi:tripeptidyl-peptidase-1